MEITLSEALLAFFAAFATSALITPIFRNIALRLEIVDRPNQAHKTHSVPVAYLGGWSIITTIAIGILAVLIFRPELLGNRNHLLIFFSAPLVLAFIGLIDDLRNLGPLSRLLAQVSGSIFVSTIFLRLGLFGEPSNSSIFNVLISVFWIVGITNSLNFIDNLDGGAGGIVLISTLFLALAAALGGQYALASIATLMAGATLGFLIWNLNPARIYLGDSGALFLGSLLSILIIRLDPPTESTLGSWMWAFSLVAIPILDTSVAVISRLSRGLSPWQGGRDHLSHRLLSLDLSKRQVALLIWLMQAYFCLLATTMKYVDRDNLVWIESSIATSWLLLFYLFWNIRISSVDIKHNN